jgi:hypothetical protein
MGEDALNSSDYAARLVFGMLLAPE